MKKHLIRISKVIGTVFVVLYLAASAMFYINQENLIFFPEKHGAQYQYNFEENFEEINIETNDELTLNNLLFKADTTKGVILFLHGNGGSIKGWGKRASIYTDLGYDIFMVDYRGYGKSEGSITNETMLYEDMQTIYDEVRRRYSEEKIIVMGYSLGTGLAAKVASTNNPRLLILLAPYYNFPDVVNYTTETSESFVLKLAGFLPTTWFLKYHFKTNEFIQNCDMPIVIFHGDADKEIYLGSSLKLQNYFKPEDKLIILEAQVHNGIMKNQEYLNKIGNILANNK